MVVFLYVAVQQKDKTRVVKKSLVSDLNKKLALYLLYSGTAYVRTDD